MLMVIDEALRERASRGDPIRVGVVGGGFMARGMVRQMERFMTGFEVVAVSNRTIDTAEEIYRHAGIDRVERISDPSRLDDLIGSGTRAVTSDPQVLCSASGVEVVLEATGEVEFGAHVATAAIRHGKHVVLVNAEVDATVGPMLKVMADRRGVVITNADGDEPGVAMNLVRFVEAIGYRPVLAGNIKGFYDPHRNPDTQAEFARLHGQRPKMITSFADGTKLSMEGTVLANATGFGVAQRGMTGHKCDHVKQALELYDPDQLLESPLVDFVLGAEPGSGAFVLGYDDDPDRAAYMRYFKLGDGPLYLFYRPFHLTHLEAPLSVARAVLFGDPTIAPRGAPVCEVVATAKRDLSPGQVLDGIGGFDCYGLIDNVEIARGEDLLPMGLAEGCRIVREVSEDQPIRMQDVEFPERRLVDSLREEQRDHFAAQPTSAELAAAIEGGAR